MSKRTGVVLAGGYARRFGKADKTLAKLGDDPLIYHVVENLRPVVDDIVVSCRVEQQSAFRQVLGDVRMCPDPAPDRGPLAGLAATLETVDGDAIALATADMPCVPTELYADCFDRLGGVDAVVVRDEGILQPAPGIYRLDRLRASVSEQRSDDERRLRSIFESLSIETLDGNWVRDRWGDETLVDVNTKADLERL